MTVREWKYADILAIADMQSDCFASEAWSYKTLVSAFENPQSFGLVAVEGEDVIGFGCITCAADAADLENVLVAEEYRRGGVGGALVDRLLQEARNRGAEKVFLEVRVSNAEAMRLYLSHGFVGAYARTRYYFDGEDCLVMSRILRK